MPNIMNDLRKERREPNGAPLPTRGEGLGWGIIFLKNKKLHTPPLPLPFMGGELLAHKLFPFWHTLSWNHYQKIQ